MKKIKLSMNTLCSGIGCQERGIRNTGLFDLEVVATSEIDKEAVVSYAAIHCNMTNEIIASYPFLYAKYTSYKKCQSTI